MNERCPKTGKPPFCGQCIYIEKHSGDCSFEYLKRVDHPQHYYGDTTYEVIKVLEAWGLDKDFCLGNVVKYIARADKKGAQIEDLEKALWYLKRKIDNLKKEQG